VPWSKALLKDDGLIHQVRCKTCSAVGKKDVVMVPEWDTIFKHGQRDCHKKKTLLYVAWQPTTVLEQIQGCNIVESRRKRVHSLPCLPFSLLVVLCKSIDLEKSCISSLTFLNVPRCIGVMDLAG
jgi:hypothetical protein